MRVVIVFGRIKESASCLENHLKRFVVVPAAAGRAKRRKDGGDRVVMKMRTTNKVKRQLLPTVLPRGLLAVGKRDEEVAADPWKIGPNRMKNGIIPTIDLVPIRVAPACSSLFSLPALTTGPSASYESNQPRAGGGGWRSNAGPSDRDQNARRPQNKRDRTLLPTIDVHACCFCSGMPEWMDDSHDSDGHLISATFEQDGTFTGLPSIRETTSNGKSKASSQPSASADETSTHTRTVSGNVFWRASNYAELRCRHHPSSRKRKNLVKQRHRQPTPLP